MLIEEIIGVEETKQVWGRTGGTIKRKFRCSSGHRKGRVVSNPAQCFKPVDIKKRMTLKKTKAKLGSRLTRKANRTKRLNPMSRRVQTLNKGR